MLFDFVRLQFQQNSGRNISIIWFLYRTLERHCIVTQSLATRLYMCSPSLNTRLCILPCARPRFLNVGPDYHSVLLSILSTIPSCCIPWNLTLESWAMSRNGLLLFYYEESSALLLIKLNQKWGTPKVKPEPVALEQYYFFSMLRNHLKSDRHTTIPLF